MIVDSCSDRSEKNLMSVQQTLRGDLQIMAQNTAVIGEQIVNSSETQEAAMADMRRQHMMLMELVSSDRDSIKTKIEDLNANINVKVVDSSTIAQAVRSEISRSDNRADSVRSYSITDQNSFASATAFGGFQ